MNTTISVIGKVKTNKNGTFYIDTDKGRVFLGKSAGFAVGQDIMGDAICSVRKVEYPAIGVVGQPGYVAATIQDAWQCENFISEEMLTKQLEAKARKATAQFNIAVITKKTATVATIENIFDLVG